jgi:glycosyltransferase involved in cell wall biosynthesis
MSYPATSVTQSKNVSLVRQARDFIAAGNAEAADLILEAAKEQGYPNIILNTIADGIASLRQRSSDEKETSQSALWKRYICRNHLYSPPDSSTIHDQEVLQALVEKDLTESGFHPATEDLEAAVPTKQEVERRECWLEQAEQEGLFSESFYRTTNPDLGSETDVRQHFRSRSVHEPHRDPSQYFSVEKYYSVYRDVKDAGMNALEHYIRYGHDREIFASDYFDRELQRFPYALDIELTKAAKGFTLEDLRIGVMIHIHYPDVLRDAIENLKAIADHVEFIITSTSEECAGEIECILREHGLYQRSHIKIYHANRGRDLGAFFNEFQSELSEYDFVGKVHMKKSPHLGEFGRRWSDYLLTATIGSVSLLRQIIWTFIQCDQIGILAPVPFPGTTNDTWDSNFEIAKKIWKELNLGPVEAIPTDLLRYPSATVFWFRPAAFAGFKDSIKPEFFPEEPIPIDGTSAHALERLIPSLARKNGLDTVFYTVPSLTLRNSKEWEVYEWLERANSRECYLVVSHDASNTGAPRTALAIQRELLKTEGADCLVILLQGGPLAQEFIANGDVIAFENNLCKPNIADVLKYASRPITIITNTIITSEIGRLAREYGHIHVSLVHEYASTGYWPQEFFRDSLEADISVFPGESILAEAVSYAGCYPAGKLMLMPQGLYDNSFPHTSPCDSYQSVRKELGLPQHTLIVLGCGMIEDRKGIDLFLQTAKMYQEEHERDHDCSVAFIWIGGIPTHAGNDQDSAKLLIAKVQNECPSNVYLLGACRRTDRYMAAADLFYLSSRLDPFPGVVLEAMKCKKPIICFDGCTNVDHAFINRVGGVLAERGDVLSASGHIASLLGNRTQREGMGKWNQQRIRDHFNFSEYVSVLCEEVQKLRARFGCIEASNDPSCPDHFSIVTPAYKTSLAYLQQLIASLLRQRHSNWELCLSCSDLSPESSAYINGMAASDQRIKVSFQQENQGIAGNTNAALDLARGDIIIFVDHDDTLPSFSLQELQSHFMASEAEFVYTAEDKMDASGRYFFNPVRKPLFSHQRIIKNNFITHITAIRASLLERVGHFRAEYDGAQDYDFVLRASQATDKISYCDRVLYHWRVFPESTSSGNASVKPYAVESGRKALVDYFARIGKHNLIVRPGKVDFTYEVIQDAP